MLGLGNTRLALAKREFKGCLADWAVGISRVTGTVEERGV